MSEDIKTPKSPVQLIYEELFKRLEQEQEFNSELIDKIKHGAKEGILSNFKNLAAILKS